MELPHDPEDLEHLRGDERRLPPVRSIERDLRHLLPCAETVVGDATPEANVAKAVVNPAAEVLCQVGAGYPWAFVDGEIGRHGKGWCDTAKTAAALAVRFEAGVLLRQRAWQFKLSGHCSEDTTTGATLLTLMADKEQVAKLRTSAAGWNRWRAKNPGKRADLRGADLRHTDLRRADLRQADLSESDLSQANLSEARLGGADLTRAVLIEADLIGADLSRAVLNGAALVGTYLIGADLRRADLNVTDLRGADLRGADLRGADLTKSFFLIQAQIETAIGDRGTKLSASVIRPEHWRR